MAVQRTPEEIRASIEANRLELGRAVVRLRDEVSVAKNWRLQVERHKREVLIGAAMAGFVIGGGIAAVTTFKRRGRRRR